MALVRSLVPDDIPEVARLRQKCFRQSSQADTQAVESRLHQILLGHPWQHAELPSLVARDETSGEVVGFLGVVPRPMRLQGKTAWMSVHTQLMADPAAGGLIGVQLLQASFRRSQALCFADLANDSAKRMWDGLGGQTAKLYSIYWVRPLRPVAYALARLGTESTSRATRMLLRMTKLAAPLADRYVASASGRYARAVPTTSCTPIDAGRLLELYAQFMKGYVLAPDYTAEALDWLIADLGSQLSRGEVLRLMEVRDAQARTIGWFICVQSNSGIAQVIQLGGRPDRIPAVLDALVHQAELDGGLCVAGRMQPEYLPSLGSGPMHLSREGPWVVACSRDPAVQTAIHAGTAWLSRLEGEWWMNF